jgi:ABC-type multidrug transport system ATPase subunit
MTHHSDIAVRVSRLRKVYADVAAVDGIDLEIGRGEVFALLGPNGAGKTTTVEVLEGYRRRDAGEVAVLGHDPAQPTREWRSRVGIVLQSPHDTSELTVREIVSHFATFYANPRNPNEVIERAGLAEKRSTRARHLPVASAGDWTSRSGSLVDRNCSSSTSRQLALTPRHGVSFGISSPHSPTRARRSS